MVDVVTVDPEESGRDLLSDQVDMCCYSTLDLEGM